MRVVNISGIPFSAKYNGGVVVIPFNNMAYDVPDDFGLFGELRVIIPPAPVAEPMDESVVEITDDDLQNAKTNVKNEKPLKGVKIKKNKRKKILSSKKKARKN